jgi:hypothetical protein
MNSEILFDKLAYIDKLKGAGIDERQARGHADALDTALREGIATHADIVALRADIGTVRTDLRAEITAVRTDLSAEITAVRTDLRTEIRDLELRIIVRLGAGMATLFALFFAALHLWPPHQ